MGKGRASGDNRRPPNGVADTTRSFGAVRVTVRDPVTELYFPPLRAAGSALMLALFGCACGIIGGAAIAGLLHSGASPAASLLAFAFAGIFALPLAGLGLWFVACAVWAAANSLTVEISSTGLRTQRRFIGYAFARRALAREEITALDAELTAKYVGIFSAVRYYRLFARGRGGALLIADSLKGPDVAAALRTMVIDQLQMGELTATSNEIPAGEGRAS